MSKRFRPLSLTVAQFYTLEDAAIAKLARSVLGWWLDHDDMHRFYHRNTVKSLWTRGLLATNFDDDPRGFGPCLESLLVKNVDDARYPHSPDRQMLCVWTNARGFEVLDQLGISFPPDYCGPAGLLRHSPVMNEDAACSNVTSLFDWKERLAELT
jgi:hypothetical protein